MDIAEILQLFDDREINYRLESDHCCGYILSFIDGRTYPRRWLDNLLDDNHQVEIIAESVESLLEKALANEIKKDWFHRVHGEDLNDTLQKALDYLNKVDEDENEEQKENESR